MAQPMRMKAARQSGGASPGAHAILHRARRQALAVAADEERALVVFHDQRALAIPGLDRGERLAADRHDARLAALADDAQLARDVVDVERDELGESQARGIEQLDDRVIARGETVA